MAGSDINGVRRGSSEDVEISNHEHSRRKKHSVRCLYGVMAKLYKRSSYDPNKRRALRPGTNILSSNLNQLVLQYPVFRSTGKAVRNNNTPGGKNVGGFRARVALSRRSRHNWINHLAGYSDELLMIAMQSPPT